MDSVPSSSRRPVSAAVLSSLLAFAVACTSSSPATPTESTQSESPSSPATNTPSTPAAKTNEWDPAKQGLPHFVSHQYLDLDAIYRISRFRSGEGHTYEDQFESCRSMKHYFDPRWPSQASQIRVYAPVAGTVADLMPEWAGTQVRLVPDSYPAFQVILFHVNLTAGLAMGEHVTAGQPIGTHIGSQTMSDVAVSVNTPSGFQLVSWFDVLDDATFAAYQARGIGARSEPVISRGERDSQPLQCAGEAFTSKGSIENWVTLR